MTSVTRVLVLMFSLTSAAVSVLRDARSFDTRSGRALGHRLGVAGLAMLMLSPSIILCVSFTQYAREYEDAIIAQTEQEMASEKAINQIVIGIDAIARAFDMIPTDQQLTIGRVHHSLKPFLAIYLPDEGFIDLSTDNIYLGPQVLSASSSSLVLVYQNLRVNDCVQLQHRLPSQMAKRVQFSARASSGYAGLTIDRNTPWHTIPVSRAIPYSERWNMCLQASRGNGGLDFRFEVRRQFSPPGAQGAAH